MVADMTISTVKSTATLSHILHECSLVLYSESDRPANNGGVLHVQSKGRLFIQMFSEKGQSLQLSENTVMNLYKEVHKYGKSLFFFFF